MSRVMPICNDMSSFSSAYVSHMTGNTIFIDWADNSKIYKKNEIDIFYILMCSLWKFMLTLLKLGNGERSQNSIHSAAQLFPKWRICNPHSMGLSCYNTDSPTMDNIECHFWVSCCHHTNDHFWRFKKKRIDALKLQLKTFPIFLKTISQW